MARANLNWTEDERQELCDWLRANHIDPNDVPVSAQPAVGNEQVTITTVVRNQDGYLVFDRVREQVVTRPLTVPLLVAPTGLAAVWCGIR